MVCRSSLYVGSLQLSPGYRPVNLTSYALISGHPGGVDPGDPPGHLHNDVYKSLHKRTIFFQQKATTVPPPWGYFSMLFFQQQIYNGFKMKS